MSRQRVELNGDGFVALPMPEDVRAKEMEAVNEFYRRWKSEACKLGIPHSDVGCKVLEYLINNPEKWVTGEVHHGTSELFARKPTMADFIADLHAGERSGTLRIIDTAQGSRDEKLKDSADRVLECARLVEEGTFSTTAHRHCCAFGVPASEDGLLKCSPKIPPQELLTGRTYTPRGIRALNYTTNSFSTLHSH